jgi:hypothetical protein
MMKMILLWVDGKLIPEKNPRWGKMLPEKIRGELIPEVKIS